jgi:cation diffusion facilitator family transporter
MIGSLLRPHSHDAAGSVDAALRSSTEGTRVLMISLVALAMTAAVQLIVVAASGSVALLSDTIHNFADALTALPLGLAFWLGRRPPNDRYTYGYGRSEDLAGVFIVATIVASCAVAGWEAVDRLANPRDVHHLGWVIVAGVVGFAGNEIVAGYRVRVGRRIGSAALVADGLHARTDGFTSLAVVVGAIGVAAGWRLADPIVGLVITVAILVVAKNAARDIYRRLMDAVDPGLVATVSQVLADVDGIDGVDAVRIRWVGHELHAEAEVTSDATLTLAEAHAVGEQAHHRLLHEVPRLAQATIHTSPTPSAGHDPHDITAHHFPRRTARSSGVN